MTALAGKSDAFETALLNLIFCNVAITNLGDAGGLRETATAGSLYFGLASADPTEAGDQTTNEVGYTNYVRVPVARSAAGWTVSGNSVVPFAAVTFAAGGIGTSPTATHFTIGTLVSGAGVLLYGGAISPTIVCGNGVTPQLTTATAVTES